MLDIMVCNRREKISGVMLQVGQSTQIPGGDVGSYT